MARREVPRRGGQPSRTAQTRASDVTRRAGDVQGLSIAEQFVRGLDLIQSGRLGDLSDPYKQLSAWYSGVQVINLSMGRAPFEAWRGQSDKVEDGPLVELMRQPNPNQTWRQFESQMIVHLHSKRGAAFMQKVGVNAANSGTRKLPEEVRLLPPNRVKAIVAKEDTHKLLGWKIERGANGEPGDELMGDRKDEVVPVYLAADPDSPFESVSPQVPGNLDLQTERMAGLYTASTLATGGSPLLFFTLTSASLMDGTWDPDNARKIEEKLRAKYGGVDGFRMMAAPGDWKAQNLSMRPRDMEFSLWRAWVINVIARLLGITPLLLAHYEGATGLSDAGLRVQERVNYRNKFIPLGQLIAEAWQRGIVNKFDPSVEVLFDWSEIEALQEDFGSKIVAAYSMWQMGVPLDQINEIFDLGIDVTRIPWATEWMIPPGLMPARWALDEPVPEPEPAPQVIAAPAGTAVPPGTQLSPGQPGEAGDVEEAVAAAVGREFSEMRRWIEETRGDGPRVERASAVINVWDRSARTEAQRRHRAAVAYARAARDIEERMHGRIRKAMLAHRKAVVKAFLEVSGTSLRAVMKAHPLGVNMSDEQILTATPEEVVAHSQVELTLSEVERVVDAIINGKIAGAIEPVIRDAVRAGVKNVGPTLRDVGVAEARLDAYEGHVPDIADRYVMRALTGPASRTELGIKDRVRETILDSINNGNSVKETTSALRGLFDEEMQEWETLRIARTETGIAMNGARNEAMKDNGVTAHQWSAVIDGHTRDSHKGIHGEERKIGQPFSNGLMYPGDPDGDPEEIINCRCVTVPTEVGDEALDAEAAALVTRIVKKIGSKWFVISEATGKRLSKGFDTREEAEDRLREIDYFKHKDAAEG